MWSTPFNKTLVVVPSANAKQQGGKLGDTLLPKSTPIPKPAQEEGEMSGSDLLNFFRKIFILAHGGIKRWLPFQILCTDYSRYIVNRDCLLGFHKNFIIAMTDCITVLQVAVGNRFEYVGILFESK